MEASHSQRPASWNKEEENREKRKGMGRKTSSVFSKATQSFSHLLLARSIYIYILSLIHI